MDGKLKERIEDMLCAECLKRSTHGSCAMECEHTHERFCKEVAQKVKDRL